MGIAPKSWKTRTQCFPALGSLRAGTKPPLFVESFLGDFPELDLATPFSGKIVEAPYLFRSFQMLFDRQGTSRCSLIGRELPVAPDHVVPKIIRKSAKNKLNYHCFSCQKITKIKKSIESVKGNPCVTTLISKRTGTCLDLKN